MTASICKVLKPGMDGKTSVHCHNWRWPDFSCRTAMKHNTHPEHVNSPIEISGTTTSSQVCYCLYRYRLHSKTMAGCRGNSDRQQ